MPQVFRRQFLATAGTLGLGAVLGRASVAAQAAPSTVPDLTDVWRYVLLDPKKVAADAYRLYTEKHCMYATFKAVCINVAEEARSGNPPLADALDFFPYDMMKYGQGGCGGFGTLCGSLNGGAAAISLFIRDEPTAYAMVTELLCWYEKTALPIYKPMGKVNFVDEPNFVTSISLSPLCHVSNTKWCNEAGEPVYSFPRKERCSRISADCATKVVEILNRHHREPTCTFAAIEDPAKSCVECHGPKQTVGNVLNNMNCYQCHDQPSELNHKNIPLKPLKNKP